MKAVAVLPARREVRVVDRPDPPAPSPTQARLRVRAVGLCGTDREIAAGVHGEPPPGADALVLGHEALAEIEEVGAAVTDLAPGDLVVPLVRRPCPHPWCGPCRVDRQDFCVTGDFEERGIQRRDGYLAARVVDEARYLVRVPPAVGDVAVLVEPLTIAIKADELVALVVARLPAPPVRMRGLVLGAGPIGLLAAMSMAARDVDVTVYSRNAEDSARADLVRALGATYVGSGAVPVEHLAARHGRFDVIFDGVGAAALVFGALAALAPGGACVLSGLPPPGELDRIDLGALLRGLVVGNQLVLGTVNASRAAYARAAAQLAAFRVLFPDALRALIPAPRPLADVPALLRERGAIKDVIDPGA